MTLRETVIVLCTLLGACSTAPQSYIDNEPVVERTHLNRDRVIAVAVDGDYRSTERRVPVTPGQHMVTFSAPPVSGFPVVQKTYPLAIAPCTEYYFAADRANRISQDWHLVLEDTRPVAGCNAELEIKRATALTSGSAVINGPALPAS